VSEPARRDDGSPPEPDTVSLETATRHAAELAARLARLADEVADSEEMVAKTYEDSARLRPHAAARLQEAAREARVFAEWERRQGRRLRGDDVGDDGA
jgi:hypothetical protein